MKQLEKNNTNEYWNMYKKNDIFHGICMCVYLSMNTKHGWLLNYVHWNEMHTKNKLQVDDLRDRKVDLENIQELHNNLVNGCGLANQQPPKVAKKWTISSFQKRFL